MVTRKGRDMLPDVSYARERQVIGSEKRVGRSELMAASK